jgi:hypothetical protein
MLSHHIILCSSTSSSMGACEVEAANEQTLLKLIEELDDETWPGLAEPVEAPGEPEPDLPDAEEPPAINPDTFADIDGDDTIFDIRSKEPWSLCVFLPSVSFSGSGSFHFISFLSSSLTTADVYPHHSCP